MICAPGISVRPLPGTSTPGFLDGTVVSAFREEDTCQGPVPRRGLCRTRAGEPVAGRWWSRSRLPARPHHSGHQALQNAMWSEKVPKTGPYPVARFNVASSQTMQAQGVRAAMWKSCPPTGETA